MKLVIIGAGSAYTPEIFNGIILRNTTLAIKQIVLVDIEDGRTRTEINAGLGRRMFAAAKQDNVKLTTSYNRQDALIDANFVISQIRVGGGNARSTDEHLCVSLGLLGQETTGAGGFFNAMRTVPVAIDIARDIEKICPDAWLINFTNPSGIVTEAILKYTKVKCIGLCNVPINMQADAAKILELQREDVRCITMGLNHLSFVTSVTAQGQERLPDVIKSIDGNETLMKNIPKVEGVSELINTIDLLPSPYLQYFYFQEAMVDKQQKELKDTGKTRGDLVKEIDEEMFAQYAEEGRNAPPEKLAERGGSLYSHAALDIVEALLSDTPKEMTVNIQNYGTIDDLDDTDVIEVNCLISCSGEKRIKLGTLPKAVSGLVHAVKQYERLTVEAAVTSSRKLALQALINHPLICSFEKAKKVVQAMEENFEEYINLA